MARARRKPTQRRASPVGRFFRLFWITCAVALMLLVGNAIARPHLFCLKQQEQIAELKEQIHRVGAYNAELRAEIDRLETTSGSLEEARRQGWVEPGEQPILLADPPAERE